MPTIRYLYDERYRSWTTDPAVRSPAIIVEATANLAPYELAALLHRLAQELEEAVRRENEDKANVRANKKPGANFGI